MSSFYPSRGLCSDPPFSRQDGAGLPSVIGVADAPLQIASKTELLSSDHGSKFRSDDFACFRESIRTSFFNGPAPAFQKFLG